MDDDRDGPGGGPAGETDPPLTVEVLADLQAGLLDDDTAARVRRQVRADPDAERVVRALQRVRRDIAELGGAPADPAADPASIPRVHFARPRAHRARAIAAVAGVCAALTAGAVGTIALLRFPGPDAGPEETSPTAQHITVSKPPSETGGAIPLTRAEVWGLLSRAPDYGGVLGDPSRRASCLGGLGYPASTPILGARPVEIDARPGVLLVMAADTADTLVVFAVASTCSAAETGLLASTEVPRP